MNVKWFPSSRNNYEKGRGNERIELIVLHWSSAESLALTDNKFVDPSRLASAHYAIENTEIHQYVKDEDTAFHSGSMSADKRSIGIICIGGPNMPITDATYQTLALLLEEIMRKNRLPIDRDHIKGHKEITTGFCPGSLDIDRVIEDTRKLSPQSVMDRLRKEKDDAIDAMNEKKKIADTAEARIEELRSIIREKDERLETKIEELVLMTVHQTELTRYGNELVNEINILKGNIKELALANSRSIYAIIWERIKKLWHW
jgi:N-acetyl-anhydromuramyl-L-alanine amidase AmpD